MDIAIEEGQFSLVPVPGYEEGTIAGYYFRFTDPKNGISLVASIPFDQAVELGEKLADQKNHFRPGPVAPPAAPEIVAATSADLQLVKETIPPPQAQL